MSFARASLTVSENGAVVAFEHVGDNGSSSVVVNFNLRSSFVIADIERELLRRLLHVRLCYEYLTFQCDLDDCCVALLRFIL